MKPKISAITKRKITTNIKSKPINLIVKSVIIKITSTTTMTWLDYMFILETVINQQHWN